MCVVVVITDGPAITGRRGSFSNARATAETKNESNFDRDTEGGTGGQMRRNPSSRR